MAENPQSLLLVNPKAKPKKAKPKKKKREARMYTKAQLDALVKRAKRAEKAKEAALAAKEEAEKVAKEAKAMARKAERRGMSNPKKKRTVKKKPRKIQSTAPVPLKQMQKLARRVELAEKAAERAASEVKKASKPKKTRDKTQAQLKRLGKEIAKAARAAQRAEKKASKAEEAFDKKLARFKKGKYAAKDIGTLGITFTDAAKQFSGLGELHKFAVAQRKIESQQKKAVKASKKKGRARRSKELARERATKAARKAAATRVDKLTSYPGWAEHVPPPRPGPAPRARGKRQLVRPDPWRPDLVDARGRLAPAPGWYKTPGRDPGYVYQRNPYAMANPKPKKKGRKKRKAPAKVGTLTRWGRKIPLIGQPLFGPKKRGKKNPAFSAGELAKIGLAAGGGYVGGGIASDVVSGVIGTVGLGGTLKSVGGGAASVFLAHALFKNSNYYVPVMAGAIIGAGRRVIGNFGMGDKAAAPAPAPGGNGEAEGSEGFLASIASRVKGAVGLGSYASDDELLSSIDATLDEYVDIPMDEYVDIPMDEYVEMPMEEYVEMPMEEYVEMPMDGYEELAGDDPAIMGYEELADDSWVPDDPTLGHEYIDTMEGYEELAEDFDEGIDEDFASSEDRMAARAEDLADEYTRPIPGLDYGEMSADERDAYDDESSYVAGYEELAEDDYADDSEDGELDEDVVYDDELADEYEALADDIDEAEDLGAVRRSRRTRRIKRGARGMAARLRRRGHRTRGRRAKRAIRRVRRARQAMRSRISGAAAAQLRAAVRAAILAAAQNTSYSAGSRQHFQATFREFQKRFGAGASGRGVRRAFLVAYRAATKGPKAAATAAKNVGVPAAVAAAVAAPAPAPSVDQVARGVAVPAQGVKRIHGGGYKRRIPRTFQRYAKVRRAGEGEQSDFGGIFRESIYGKRGRWSR